MKGSDAKRVIKSKGKQCEKSEKEQEKRRKDKMKDSSCNEDMINSNFKFYDDGRISKSNA